MTHCGFTVMTVGSYCLPSWILCLSRPIWFVKEGILNERLLQQEVHRQYYLLQQQVRGRYTYVSNSMILETLPFFAANLESVTGNIDFCCPWFRISCDKIDLKMTVYNIPSKSLSKENNFEVQGLRIIESS